jgi:asparagine synthase (glutamine-hydrolysing)
MPGFLGKIGRAEKQQPLFYQNKNNKLIKKSMYINDLYIEHRTINKFHNDKVFHEDDNYFVLTEGVILNSLDLIKRYKGSSLFEAITIMYKEKGNDFFKEFRGSFSGLFYDKKNNKKIIYTNHIGDKQVFYTGFGDNIVFGSEINYIIENFKINNIEYTLNKEAAYYLLTFGYMLEDNTLFNEIKKLMAGHYILIENGIAEVIQYYKLDNTPDHDQSEEEIIENIDRLFRQATKRAFDKDIEYGYKHLVALSGGLDSRMTTWVANDMGYGGNIVNYTFSQSNYLDETIPKEIAGDLKHEWIFKSLDNGLFLKDIESVVKICSGGALYYGLAHAKSALDLINTNSFGIIHSGQLGDVILGTFYSSTDKDAKYSLNDGAYSELMTNRLNENKIKNHYENEEIFKFYQRGFNGANQGLLISQESTETYSPFYDLDFMEYCLKIPVELRYKHYIYFRWILSRYSKSASYKWEKIKGKITDRKIRLLGKQVLLKQLPSKSIDYMLRKLKLKQSNLNTKNHMNPLDYWYNTNKDLRNFLDQYFYLNINQLEFDEELKHDCESLYEKGTNIEKNQVLTLLAVLKLYFGEKDEREN